MLSYIMVTGYQIITFLPYFDVFRSFICVWLLNGSLYSFEIWQGLSVLWSPQIVN